MPVNRVDSERELLFTRFRAANLAYDIFNIRLNGTLNQSAIPFDDLDERTKEAWVAAVEAAAEAFRDIRSPKSETISKKEEDNGYLVYAGCKELKKLHPALFTYAKFPEEVKEKYRELATKLYNKMDMEGGSD